MSKKLNQEYAEKEITWEKRISLITNKHIIKDLFKLISLTYLVCILLMGVIFISIGEIESLIMLLYAFALVVAGLFILMLLIMALFFGNSFNFKFTLNKKGVLCEVIDKKAKAASNAAIIAGLLTGRSGTLGAGLLAKSRESTFIPWKGLIKFIPNERDNAISLHNSWRRVLIVYTDKSNYQEVLKHIDKWVVTREERITDKIKSPLPSALLHTFLIILASMPLFMELPYPFEIHLLAPIFILCFAQATLWISSLMAYPVLLGVIYVVISIFYIGFQTRDLEYIYREGPFFEFELLHSYEWPPLIILFIALGYLVWFSLKAIKGKRISMLEADLQGEQ